MQIQVYDIGSFILRNYLLKTPIGWIAIDTGYPGGCDDFLKRFSKLGKLSELKYIFLTHAHDDHAGFLADLMEHCDAEVILNPIGLPVLAAGKSAEPEGSGYSSWVGSLYGRLHKAFTFPPVDPGDRAIYVRSDENQVFERLGLPIHIVTLPGHTADSIGLMLTETDALFCGDAAMNAVISVAHHTIWIDDAAEFQRSWEKMIALNPKRIYPSHGNPFRCNALIKHRHYLGGRKLI